MQRFIFLFFIAYTNIVSAQKYDYNWILGYPYSPESSNTKIAFTANSADTIDVNLGIEMDNSQTTISDSDGNLLFFSNGCRAFNRNNNTMQNGDSINFGLYWWEILSGSAYSTMEDIVGLPTDTPSIWNLIHYYIELNLDTSAPESLYAWRIEESKIDMRGDSGLGTVVFKNKVLVEDTIGTYVTACQHANGRDWWVLASKSSSNCLYTLLVLPDTVIQYPMQCLGSAYISGDAGQAAFSPDGTKFAWVGGYNGINVYDFDRCTGLLSNATHLPFTGTLGTTGEFGLSFSPNSRFLYVAQSSCILQFDVSAADIAASVDTVKYYTAPPDSNSFPGNYFLMQLAPDGKIYISAGSGIKYLHVIDQPDKKGDSCNVINYGLRLPNYNSFGLPSYPGNYRLGALHGSPCDTLTKTDTTGVGIVKISREKMLKIYPNPASDYVIIDYGFTDWSMGTNVCMEITDAIGQVIYTQLLPMYSGFQKLDVSKFGAGLYNVAIKRNGAIIATAKLVKE